MRIWQRYLIIFLVLIVASGGAYAYHQHTYQESSATDTAQVRMTVAGFGDKLKQVPLLASSDLVGKAMDMNYSIYIAPSLLDQWKANPQAAPGRLTSSPWPDRIDVGEVTQNTNGTYTVLGNVVEVANGASGTEVTGSYPARFTLAKGPDGWQIAGYQKL